jgi:hypothetical protein
MTYEYSWQYSVTLTLGIFKGKRHTHTLGVNYDRLADILG